MPEVELIGNVATTLDRLAEECGPLGEVGGSDRLRTLVGRMAHPTAQHDSTFPMRPPRILFELRRALGRDDLLVSDVGLHKLWIGRMYPAYEPNSVLIANGLAGMGFAVPPRSRRSSCNRIAASSR